jgi:DNA-binding IclR family transcriptional regulator
VLVDQIAGQQRLVALSGIGERFPLHCTANGKAILSCFNKQDASALIDRSVGEHPEHPLLDRPKLMRELEAVRRRNLAFDLGEHDMGISAIGAAVLDTFGRPAAVSIPAPSHRFNVQREALVKAIIAFREKMQSIVGR